MANTTVISMKLLIDKQGKRVLFAEAGKDFVDFLFHILSLPMSTVISLLGKQGMVGSLANIFESVQNLNQTYMQSDKTKDALLKPVISSSVPLLTAFYDAAPCNTTVVKMFCSTCGSEFIPKEDAPTTVCPNCMQSVPPRHDLPRTESSYSDHSDDDEVDDDDDDDTEVGDDGGHDGDDGGDDDDDSGFVKGVVTYMVMDDLVVKPMSAISSIALLSKFNVKEVGMLEEKVVNVGMTEAVNLLKASLETDKVLTSVFLK